MLGDLMPRFPNSQCSHPKYARRAFTPTSPRPPPGPEPVRIAWPTEFTRLRSPTKFTRLRSSTTDPAPPSDLAPCKRVLTSRSNSNSNSNSRARTRPRGRRRKQDVCTSTAPASRRRSPQPCPPRHRRRPRLTWHPHWHHLATSLHIHTHPSRRRVCTCGMVYQGLGMRTLPLRMQCANTNGHGYFRPPFVAVFVPPALFAATPSVGPTTRPTRTTHRISSTRLKRSRWTSSRTLNSPRPTCPLYTTL